MDYEDVLQEIGPFGRFQKYLCGMVLLACVHSAFSDLMFAFLHHVPEFHCSISPVKQFAKNSSGYDEYLSSIPWGNGSNGQLVPGRCDMFGDNFGLNLSVQNHSSAIPCMYGRTFESDDTAIAEFDMVCEDAWKKPLAVAIFFVGVGMASFVVNLSDRFGRRPVFLVFSFAQFIATALHGVSWNYVSYCVFTFLTGFFSLVAYVAVYVLATETMEMKRQAHMGLFFAAAFTFGYILTPLLAYIFPYWRHFLWATSSLGVLYIPLLWLCPESVRWLLVSKREREAKALLNRIASINGRSIDADKIYQDFQAGQTQLRKIDQTRWKDNEAKLREESSYLHFLKNRTMFGRSCVVYLGWFISSMLYFALSLNPSTLNGDHIVKTFLMGLVEFPALAFAYLFLRFLGRVRACFIVFCVAGVSCGIAPFLTEASPAAVTVLVLIGKASVTDAFSIIYIVAAEVSPTLVRTASIGVASACARIGTIIMPYLMFAGQTVNPYLPFLVMGGLSGITGLLMVLVVPETEGVSMPDTINDALENKRIYGLNLCLKFPKTDTKEAVEKEKDGEKEEEEKMFEMKHLV